MRLLVPMLKEEGGGAVQWKSIVSTARWQRHEQMEQFRPNKICAPIKTDRKI